MNKGLSDVRFSLETKYDYNIGEEVPIYLEREVIGHAIVTTKGNTYLVTNDEERIPKYEYSFEFSENLQSAGREKFTPYFSGSDGRLCVADNEVRRKHEKEIHQRKLDQVRKQSINYKYVCLSCSTVTASSKEFKSNSCKHCRRGKLERVSNW